MDQNLPRLRAWCTALAGGRFTQTTALHVDVDPTTGRWAWCAQGVAAHLAHLDGALSIASHAVTRDVAYHACHHTGHRCDSTCGTFVSVAASAWLGWDMAAELVDLTRAPAPLRKRIVRVLEANLDDDGVHLARLRGAGPYRWEVWALNDLGVTFRDIASAVRCHLGIDLDLVPDFDDPAAYVLAGAA